MSEVRCPICGGIANIALLSQGHDLLSRPLFQCSECSFCYFDTSDWSGEPFSEELNELDLGSVARCLLVADFVTAVFPSRTTEYRVLDWGGGDGLLTRVLRDRGVNCVWHDPFVEPRFVGDSRYDDRTHINLTVVSEVFLHLTDPVSAMKLLLSKSDVVIMTAVVPPREFDAKWWYLMPATGQHVAFYPKNSLQALAAQTNSCTCSDGRFFHVFSHRRLPFVKRLLIRFRPLAYGRAFLQHGARMLRVAFGRSASMTADDQVRLIVARREASGR